MANQSRIILPARGSVLPDPIHFYFDGVPHNLVPARMLELAKYYYYKTGVWWIVWGTSKNISGNYNTPALKNIIAAYNSIQNKSPSNITGYFALAWASDSWVAYYTPENGTDAPESIDVRITEADIVPE